CTSHRLSPVGALRPLASARSLQLRARSVKPLWDPCLRVAPRKSSDAATHGDPIGTQKQRRYRSERMINIYCEKATRGSFRLCEADARVLLPSRESVDGLLPTFWRLG